MKDRYNFYWEQFTEEDFEKYKCTVIVGDFDGDDCIGHIRVGVVCFDILIREYNSEIKLDYDTYIGGVDAGYGIIEKDSYPYDFEDGGTFPDEIQIMSYEEFKEFAEIRLSYYINTHLYAKADITVKASEDLKIW